MYFPLPYFKPYNSGKLNWGINVHYQQRIYIFIYIYFFFNELHTKVLVLQYCVLKVVVKDFTNTEYFNAGLRSGLYFINTNSSKLHVQ